MIEPIGGSERAIATYLLGSVLTACLQQLGILTLHASAIGTATGAVLFSGFSGQGKSTLLAALVERGQAMLADDVTGVVLDSGGRPIALPAFPCLRLRDDAVEMLNWQARKGTRAEGWSDKYVIRVNRFHSAPLAVRSVFILTQGVRTTVEIDVAAPSQAVKKMVRRIHRRNYLCGDGRWQEHFRTIGAVAQQVPIFRMRRPVSCSLATMVDAVDQCLRIDSRANP